MNGAHLYKVLLKVSFGDYAFQGLGFVDGQSTPLVKLT